MIPEERPSFRCECADARKPEGYARLLQGVQPRLLHTDPPYCLLTRRRRDGDLREARANKKIDRNPIVRFETVRDYRIFTEAWMAQALPCLSADATLVLWTNLLGKEPLISSAQAHGFTSLLGEFVWGKRSTERNSNEQTLRVYEVALVLARKPLPPLQDDEQVATWAVVGGYDDDGEASRWGSHPHHKPFHVLEPLLRSYSRPGDWVLDPFSGSGSIPAAALKLGRNALCLEVEPEWAPRVSARLAQVSSQHVRSPGKRA